MGANAAGESMNLKYEYITPLDAPGRLTSTSVQRNEYSWATPLP